MKKIAVLISGLVLVGLIYSYQAVQGKEHGASQNATSDYIIIKYIPSTTSDVVVYSGGNNIQRFPLTKEQKEDFGTLNLVIDLLNKYDDEGYTLVSTTSFHLSGLVNGTQCILKKLK